MRFFIRTKPSNDVAKLFKIWDRALAQYIKNPDPQEQAGLAIDTVSLGSRFYALFDKDSLLKEIHDNFASLEAPGHNGENGEDEKLWTEQIKLIAKAKQKYQ